MAGELDNMKRMDKVVVRKITDRILSADPLKLVMQVNYDIVADDGATMYGEAFSMDVSHVANIANKTLAERLDLATKQAVKDAKQKHGK